MTRQELLAVIMAVKHFRSYLYGQTFRLRTNHALLWWLFRQRDHSHQVASGLEVLAKFPYALEHRVGTNHGNADGLSHSECVASCRQCQLIEQRHGGPTHSKLWEESCN